MQRSAPLGSRRRFAISALAALLTLSVMSVVGASARPVARTAHARSHVSAKLFDSRAVNASVSPSRAVLRARASLAQSLGNQGLVIPDAQTGTLRMVGRLDGFLTHPSVRPAQQIAMDYVRAHLRAFGLDRADLRTFHFRQDYVDIDGTHHLSWTQSAGRVTAFRNGLKANVTADGRLINLTGSPVHGLRAATTLPHLGSLQAIDTARRSAGAGDLSAQRDDTAKLVLFSAPRGAKLAWQTTTWVDPNYLALSVVDAQTGGVLWRANLTHGDVGTGQAVDMYPSGDLPNGGGDVHAVTFPVFDGTALSGNNAHVFADVNDDDKAVAKDEVRRGRHRLVGLPAGLGYDGCVAELLHALLLLMGQDGPQGLEPQPQLVRCAALPLPQHVPRPPVGGADRVHGGRGQLPGHELVGPG